MYFKFLLQDDFSKKLHSFNGDFITLWKPLASSNESHCYVELHEEDFEQFLKHFQPDDGAIIEEGADELPTSLMSFSSNNGQRGWKFETIKK